MKLLLSLSGAWLALALLGPAAAPPAQQTTPEPYPAPFELPPGWPTPDETGAITVIIQPGDSLWGIATNFGLSVQQLAALNGLSESSGLIAGQALIIGYGPTAAMTLEAPTVESPTAEPPTPEPPLPEATPTDTPPPPTPRATQSRPRATICLSAFDDLDTDTLRDDGEPLRAGVAFTVYNAEAVVINYITDGVSEPKCIEDLSPGQYYITRSVSPNETLTTQGDWALSLTDNTILRQDFGSIMSSAPQPTADPAAAAETSPQATATAESENARLRSRTMLLATIAGTCILLILGVVLFLRTRESR